MPKSNKTTSLLRKAIRGEEPNAPPALIERGSISGKLFRTMQEQNEIPSAEEEFIRAAGGDLTPQMIDKWRQWLNQQLERLHYASRKPRGQSGWNYFPAAWNEAAEALGLSLEWYATMRHYVMEGRLPTLRSAIALAKMLQVDPVAVYVRAYLLTPAEFSALFGHRARLIAGRPELDSRLSEIAELPADIRDKLAAGYVEDYTASERIRQALDMTTEQFAVFCAQMRDQMVRERTLRQIWNDQTPLGASMHQAQYAQASFSEMGIAEQIGFPGQPHAGQPHAGQPRPGQPQRRGDATTDPAFRQD